jgi:hypothetical protein
MNSTTQQGRPHFTGEERESWISRFRSSGLSQARFADQNGLKLKTLQRWLYRRGAQAARKRKPPVPAHGDRSRRIDRTAVAIHRKPRRTPSPTFREVRLPALGPARAGWVAEVTWPGGVTVRLRAGVEAAWMEVLLGAERRAC